MQDDISEWAHVERRIVKAIMINFMVFFVVAIVIGGSAMNGGVNEGLYTLSNGGATNAVHPALWYYSLIHSAITLGSLVLFFVYKIFMALGYTADR